MGEALPVSVKNERSSNIELMRIVMILLIIMHHYVVNSTVMDTVQMNAITPNVIFLQFWGLWGKTVINAFILVSGFFLCTGRLTWQKYLKLLMEILFYNIVIYVVLLMLGYETLSLKALFKVFFGLFHYVGGGFAYSFMTFYLFVPFLNLLIKNLNSNGMKRLLALLLFVQVVTVTFFFSHAFNEISWYMTIYIVGAYLRLHAGSWARQFSFSLKWLGFLVFLAWVSVLGIDYLCYYFQRGSWNTAFYFVSDSSKLLAFLIGVAIFQSFRNLPLGYSRFINELSKTTFGVLQIHANSDAMRKFLWQDLVQVPSMLNAPLLSLIFHAMMSVVLIYVVCAAIDYARIELLEKPVMKWIDSNSDKLEGLIAEKI